MCLTTTGDTQEAFVQLLDLNSTIYGVETKRLNEQVKRNIKRFPDDFMFQLTKEEFDEWKSQFATSSWGGVLKLPYAGYYSNKTHQ